MLLKYVFLFFTVFFVVSCSNNRCPEYNNQVRKQIIKQGSKITLYRRKELVVSVNNDTELVKGFDSCTPQQITYLYQRLRLSKDSTVLNGFFKIFYPNGQLKTLLFFNRGRQNGMCTDYWQDGTIQSRSYMYNGMFSGPQTKYDSNGKIREVSFSANDSQSWFIVRYNKMGKIDSIMGRPFRIMGNVTNRFHVGDEFKPIVEVPKLKNTLVSLNIRLSNSKSLMDTTISDFSLAYNTMFAGLYLIFSEKSKGKNKITGHVKLIDSANHKLIIADSFQRIIYVE